MSSNSSEGTGGGLIDAPRGLLNESGPGRIAARVVVGLFLFLLVGTGLLDTLLPVPKPKLTGGEARLDKRQREVAEIWDGSAARLVEYDLRLTSRVRRTLIGPYGMGLYHLLREAGPDVVVGPDDWLFLRDRVFPPTEFDEDVLREAAQLLVGTRRRLAGYGVELVVMPVPRKAVVSRQHLPSGVDPRSEIDRRFLELLEEQGLRTLDLLDVYEGVEADLFFPPDSHWTEEAERLAAEALAKQLGVWVTPKRRKTKLVSVAPEPPERKTFYFFGVGPNDRTLDYLDERTFPAYEVHNLRDQPYRFPNKKAASPLGLVGTSYTARRDFPQFLAHFSNAPVWNMALPGAMPFDRLTYVLRVLSTLSAEEIGLRTLVMELPMHNVINNTAAKTSQLLFSAAAPRHVLELAPLKDKSLGKRLSLDGRTILTSVAQGRFLHDGAGALSIELTGEPPKGELGVEIQVGDFITAGVWPPQLDRVTLPVLSPTPTNEAIRVLLRGKVKPQVESARLVLEVDEASGREVNCDQVVPGEDGTWSQSVRFPRTLRIPRHGVLYLMVRNSDVETLGWRVETAPGQVIEQAPMPSAGQSAVVVDLQSLVGQRLKSITVTGTGPCTGRVVRKAFLHALPEVVEEEPAKK